MILHLTVSKSNVRFLYAYSIYFVTQSLDELDSLRLISSPLILFFLYPSLQPFLSASCHLSSLVSYHPNPPSVHCVAACLHLKTNLAYSLCSQFQSLYTSLPFPIWPLLLIFCQKTTATQIVELRFFFFPHLTFVNFILPCDT